MVRQTFHRYVTLVVKKNPLWLTSKKILLSGPRMTKTFHTRVARKKKF